MINPQKKEQVKKISDAITISKNFILITYQAVNTKTFNDLKANLKKVNSSLTIIKNTLFEKTINLLTKKNKKFSEIKSKFFPLKDPTAVVYLGENWSNALKIYYDFTKSINNISYKLGFLDQEIYNNNDLIKISKLPEKNQLIAKIIGSFKNPTQKLVYSMNFNMMKFVYILKQKSGGGENNV